MPRSFTGPVLITTINKNNLKVTSQTVSFNIGVNLVPNTNGYSYRFKITSNYLNKVLIAYKKLDESVEREKGIDDSVEYVALDDSVSYVFYIKNNKLSLQGTGGVTAEQFSFTGILTEN